MRRRQVKGLVTVFAIAVTAAFVSVGARAEAAADVFDDFTGALDAAWTLRDGYADELPADTANHATFSTTGDHLSISIPGGAEHNQWLLRHAEAQRPYLGTGVYEIKVDTRFSLSQQVGISFESSPGTFMHFMLYTPYQATSEVGAYVERFVNDGVTQDKTTVIGASTGLPVVSDTSWYLRVTVVDNVDPTLRTWKFEWSVDDITWTSVSEGVIETSDPLENIGSISEVGVFAGNQPSGFSAYDALIDYFSYSAEPLPPVVPPPAVTVFPTDGAVDLSWGALPDALSYNVYRSTTPGGTPSLIGSPTVTSFTDAPLTNSTNYYYAVAAVYAAGEGELSAPVLAVPRPDPFDGLPTSGRILGLSARDLASVLSDGDAVSSWRNAAGGPAVDVPAAVAEPTFVASGADGEPAVRFDGVDDFFEVGAGFDDFTAGITMYAVARPASLQLGAKLVSLGDGPGANNVVLGRAGVTAGLQYFTTSSAGQVGFLDTAGGFAENDTVIVSAVQPGGAANAQVLATVSSDLSVVGSGNVFVPPVVTRDVNFIGKSHFFGDGFFEGDISEVLVYDRELTAVEQSAVLAFFWGLYGDDPLVIPAVNVTPGSNELSVTWDAPADPAGASVVDYRVEISDDAGATWSEDTVVAAPATDAVLQSLTAGVEYLVRVRAWDGTDYGPYTDPVAATPAPAVPGALTVVSQSPTELLVSWSDVVGEDFYSLEMSEAGDAFVPVAGSPFVADTVSVPVTGLAAGVEYCFRVQAVNAGGPSGFSSEVCATLLAPPVADYSADVVSVTEGGSVLFTDESTNSPTEWLWSFEGGTPASSTLQNPMVVYDTPGVFEVSLTASNAGGSDTVTKTGFITVEAAPPPVETFGLLRVATSPALPSRIFVDGIARSDWGVDWLTVATGQHTVCFSDVVGFETPPCEVITVNEGATTVVQGDFVQSGLLKVEVSPAGLPTTIFVDGQWRDEYGLFTFIAPGDYEVCWGDVAGFQAPDCQVVSIASGENVTVSGEFVPSANPTPGPAPVPDVYGYLRVTTSPAVPARVVVDGLERADWALTWVKVPVGEHVVCFSDVIGFETPDCETVMVVADQTTAVVGNYASLGLLKVGVEPAGLAVDVVVDGVGRNQFGAYFFIEPGTYEVCGTDAAGFVTPACESVTVVGGAQSDTTLSYGPA